jgi:hypothetical protein
LRNLWKRLRAVAAQILETDPTEVDFYHRLERPITQTGENYTQVEQWRSSHGWR